MDGYNVYTVIAEVLTWQVVHVPVLGSILNSNSTLGFGVTCSRIGLGIRILISMACVGTGPDDGTEEWVCHSQAHRYHSRGW